MVGWILDVVHYPTYLPGSQNFSRHGAYGQKASVMPRWLLGFGSLGRQVRLLHTRRVPPETKCRHSHVGLADDEPLKEKQDEQG